VLAWESGTPREIVERLRSLGYRVVELDPSGIEDIAAELLRIGDLTGSTEEASRQAAVFLAGVTELEDAYSGQQPVTVYFQISAQPFYSISDQHFIGAVIKLCGGRNIFADLPGLALPVSEEAVVTANPDAMLAAVSMGDATWRDSWIGWQQLSAAENGNMFDIDRDLISRPGLRVIEGARQVCEALATARQKNSR